MAQQYGELVYLRGLGTSILVLNSSKSINDLLEKRGSNYSHRPIMTMAGELMGTDESPVFRAYDDTWKLHRKLAHHALNPQVIVKYIKLQEQTAAKLVRDFIADNGKIHESTRLAAGRVVIAVAYALEVKDASDEYITHTETTLQAITAATMPGRYLVDFFPIMKHLPSFFAFQREGKRIKAMTAHLMDYPLGRVRQEIEQGTAKSSFTRDLLLTYEYDTAKMSRAEFEEVVRWASGALYGAGGETTHTLLLSLVLCMAMNPTAQAKAQAEIDKVVGSERLPSLQDRDSLTYTVAVIKETMRWRPPLPLSIPRRTERDDEYQGYFIPANTIVMPNAWLLSRQDDSGYPVEEFHPERFLGENPPVDPESYIFGFGRRICPGRYLAENSLFIASSYIVASCVISPALDTRGNEIPINPTFVAGLVSYPDRFVCSIKPRSASKAALIDERIKRDEDY
ncbi:hypothetical protein HGRIS_009340 [Hohenbuehelia grisea]|uniref:Cytochrome P450 n=1 Tax=Hohenbuehelia grisea TaxID=104357 RepID=A0ABR3J199_9AGAR